MSPRRAIPEKKKDGLPTWVVAAGIGVVVVVGVIVLFILQTPSAPSPTPPSTGVTAAGTTKGDPNALIPFVEFSDFQ